MKPNFFVALVAGAGIFGAVNYYRKKIEIFRKYDYRLTRVKYKGYSGFPPQVKLELFFDFINKSEGSIKIGGTSLQLYIGGQLIGTANVPQLVNIAPNSTTPISALVTLGAVGTGTSLWNIVTNYQQLLNQQLTIKGSFEVETAPGVFASVPVDYKTSLKDILI